MRSLFHEIVQVNFNIIPPKDIVYNRKKYKQTVKNFVPDKKSDDKCDYYWNISEKYH